MDDPAAMRRRLRVELKRLRAQSGSTQREVADALDWSPSKIIRIESGQVGISVTDLHALVRHYGLSDDGQLGELVQMARGSKQQPFAEYRDVLPAETIKFFAYEASASLIRNAQPLLVPGLLQTEEYTRALMEGFGSGARVIDRRMESRRERREILDREEPPKLFHILDEAVLRRAVGGPAAMERQLHHLLKLAERPHVTIQVLPFARGAHQLLRGPFVHLEFPVASDPDVLFLDNSNSASRFIDDPEVTAEYQEKFLMLEDLAAPAEELPEFVERARRGLADAS